MVLSLLLAVPMSGKAASQTTVSAAEEESIIHIVPHVEERVRAVLAQGGFAYPPPASLSFLVFKEERILEVWLHNEKGAHFLKSYPVLGMSGYAGPKQRQGDLQVPEGLYHIVWLNPHSDFHLSMKLDYPNEFDRRKAEEENRSHLGGDIFIHGGTSSVGCIAMGDAAIEELFVMTLMAGSGPAEVIVAPYDFRRQPAPSHPELLPRWLPELYQQIATRLAAYPMTEY
ncbi:L,D-transpeptidase family protein [Candidatus Magnetaquicoccus inordinatus]|uniref:L,D-transpeptidase family protein n=1 Tax=Candidatus Magnetaquicoccus inordinatus TaxID=2496818 RepID=UPI00187D4A19|nr:L,D-transpeptidase family protein [Candidatus Magnetaquicoccus inordinatus]